MAAVTQPAAPAGRVKHAKAFDDSGKPLCVFRHGQQQLAESGVERRLGIHTQDEPVFLAILTSLDEQASYVGRELSGSARQAATLGVQEHLLRGFH